MAKFEVNDIVKATRSRPNWSYMDAGTEGRVVAVDATGRYEYYTVEYDYYRGNYGGRNKRQHRVTGGNLALVKKGVPPVTPKAFKDMSKEDLAKRVVEVAERLAAEHDWCGVVQDGLKEMGLEEYLTETSRQVQVVVTVDVEGELGWDDARYFDEAEELVCSGDYSLDSTKFL